METLRVVCITLALCAVHCAAQECIEDDRIIDQLMNGYNKHVTPNGRRATNIQIQIWLDDVIQYNKDTQSIDVQYYLNEQWDDERLRFRQLRPCSQNITASRLFDQIWQPQTTILKSRDARVVQGPMPDLFLMLFDNGTVWVNRFMVAKPQCQPDHSAYPFDTVYCEMFTESFTGNIGKTDFDWDEGSGVSLMLPKDKLAMQQFQLTGHRWYKTTPVYPAGQWPNLVLSFRLERQIAPSMRAVFFPTAVLVLVGVLSTALGVASVSARALSIVVCLAGVVLVHAVNAPDTPTCTWLDTWTGGCVAVLLAALLLLLLSVWRGRAQGKPVEIIDEFSRVDASGVSVLLAVYIVGIVVFAVLAPLFASEDWPAVHGEVNGVRLEEY